MAISRRMKFKLGETVTFVVSGETGTIIARNESQMAEPAYLVRYADKNGCGHEHWWTQSSIRGA